METIILILAYNEEKHIERAIRSVINQDDKNIELYFVNDASTDTTLAKASALLSQSGLKYRILDNPENMGVAKSAAAAFEYVSNRDCFLIRLDADDVLLPHSISDLKKAYCPGHLVVGSYWEKTDHYNRVTPKSIYEALACGVLMYVPDIAKAGGLVDANVGIFIEYDLYFRMMATGIEPIIINEVVYTYYRQPGSLTRDSNAVNSSLQALRDRWGDDMVSRIRKY